MKKPFKYIALLSLGLALASCEDFIKDLDIDPNNPSQVAAPNLLQGVILADALYHEGDASRIAAMWTAQFTGEDRQYIPTDAYQVTAGTFDDVWSLAYYNALTQARLMSSAAGSTGNQALQGVAQVLEAHTAGTTTALFGDIPYRQAGNRDEFPNPVFDPQAQVYADLQQLLTTAIENLGKVGGIPATDLVYQGDKAKWTAAAHTLKARYYLHVGDYDNAIASAKLGISSPANDWVVAHADGSGAQNVYYQFLELERNGYLGATNSYAANILDPSRAGTANNRNNAKTNEAGRFAYYFSPAASGNNYGIRVGEGFSAPDAAYPLVTYSENQLILAEAYARKGQSDLALTALNNHRATLEAMFDGTYAAYEAADIPAGGLLKEILTERYVTFIGQIEAFNDVRRTDNALGLPIKGNGATSIPQRFLYPQSEVNTNTNTPSPLPGLFVPTPVNN
ncbi:SusD/RagB family nutrient-binding outer membrane lipoprotein [Hymenobacter lutimineralis]|uniref:SusD/RagB family nutrient-binding outer membrane lipoprotein n=1 Tax=Hymenobacter lutimineralis TaxID=2606448 RepID=A0A5D6V238_9BACT|nr:SusD/RagB family nutrient-binding outer membrane lipoprotein [Hymenobacter lutimineralis]TYZ08634.1 SusD/RagB family nutrient-binding outer membrane lipoprotein [Hymenobacter lutimineralis]